MKRPEDLQVVVDVAKVLAGDWTAGDWDDTQQSFSGDLSSLREVAKQLIQAVTTMKQTEVTMNGNESPLIELDTFHNDPKVGPAAKYHALRVRLPGVIVYFSYGVIIGFRLLGATTPVLSKYGPDHSSWSRTTCRHLNMLDGGGTAKKVRCVDYNDMIRTLNTAISGGTCAALPTVGDFIPQSPVASRVANLQGELDLQEGVEQ